MSFSASSVWIKLIWLDLVCVSDDHAASGFTPLFSGEDGRITTDAPSWRGEGCLVRSPVQTSLVFTGTKTVSHRNSSRLGRGRAPGSNKSRTNIQYNVERLISKNLKQNCVHQQVPMKLAADLCCYVTPQQIGENFPTSHDPWARRTPINAPLWIKTLENGYEAADFI